MEIFDRQNISFVSVTQQFNTSTSMGRLILNVLLSFAQFEREMISERTRDKMGAARRKGKYVGGVCMLGYDIDRERKKLVINAEEAERVRQTFQLYLEHRGLLPVVQELDRRNWCGKSHVTLKGKTQGGSPFTKTSLHKLLTNVIYRGQVRHRGEIYPGEHVEIIDEMTWNQVQALLKENAGKRRTVPLSTRGLLSGILRCKNCDCQMTLVASGKGGTKRYRYYVCCSAQKKGWKTCPTKSIPAVELDHYLVAQLHSHSLIAADFGALPLLAQQELLSQILSGVDYDGETRKLSIHLPENASETL